jgi:hypothetical protein
VVGLELGRGPVLEPAPFDEIARKPTSYGIPIRFPFRTAFATAASRSRGSICGSIRRATGSSATSRGE